MELHIPFINLSVSQPTKGSKCFKKNCRESLWFGFGSRPGSNFSCCGCYLHGLSNINWQKIITRNLRNHRSGWKYHQKFIQTNEGKSDRTVSGEFFRLILRYIYWATTSSLIELPTEFICSNIIQNKEKSHKSNPHFKRKALLATRTLGQPRRGHPTRSEGRKKYVLLFQLTPTRIFTYFDVHWRR